MRYWQQRAAGVIPAATEMAAELGMRGTQEGGGERSGTPERAGS